MKNYKKTLFISCILAFALSACSVSTVVKINYSGNIATEQVNNNLLYYYLPETLLNIEAKITIESYYLSDTLLGANVIDRKYTISPETIADTKKY